ncbi:MAG TPA: hypothetical protein VF421_16125 [Niabella sp.]
MDKKPKAASGILGSLKKLIFEEDRNTIPVDTPASQPEQQSPLPDTVIQSTAAPADSPGTEEPTANTGEMKIRVLDLLEKLNEDGIDFFEVWNAAAAMGTIDATTIKAAFTSLRYVDKSLTKEKLLTTGNNYAVKIKEVIDQDVAQKQKQKTTLQANRVSEKQALQKEVSTLETQIKELQTKLTDQQKKLGTIDSSYDAQLNAIDLKITIGRAAVTEVVTDINHALSIIEKNIN